MASYKLAPLADDDLAKIVATTIGTWGYEQAKAYANARSFPVEKHVVFYQQCDGGIEVARILHQRMDPSKHF